MQDNQDQVKRFRELLDYNPETGVIRVRKTNRILEEDYSGCTNFFDNLKRKSYKLKLDKLAYILAYGVFPDKGSKILHKNTDKHDNSMQNLKCLNAEEALLVKECLKNLNGGIKVQPHPTDVFCYKVSWFEEGIERHKVISDVVVAKRFESKLRYKFTKFLSKYCYLS